MLQPAGEGSDQQAQLRYIASNVQWSNYNKIMVVPVTFWADDDSKVSAQDQEILCNYFYVTLVQYLGKNFEIAYRPGPGVARLQIALSDATSATPVLRSVSVVVPQARVLNMLKYAATGTYAFVGSATAEAKLTDSQTGQLLAAWADQRFGGLSVKNATVWQQGEAENAMNYWANGLDQKLVSLGAGKSAAAASDTNWKMLSRALLHARIAGFCDRRLRRKVQASGSRAMALLRRDLPGAGSALGSGDPRPRASVPARTARSSAGSCSPLHRRRSGDWT